MVNKILTTLYIIITLSMPSCIENMDTPDFSENTDGFVRFTVNIPSAAIPRENTLRSRQIAAETLINEIQVLVFENGLYSYKATGGDINQTDGVASFSARIRSNNVPTTIYIVANNNAVVDANEPAIDSSIDDVNTLFNLPYTSAGTSGNVALWGSYRWENGVDATIDNIVTPISLLRAMARVDVEVAPTASTNFTLQSVQVFRAANTIQIIPNSPNTELSVTTPSIPEGAEFDVNTNPVTSISATLSEAQVYIPESSAPPQADQVSQATCIVVGGRFNNSATTRFYRLDFNPLIEGHPLGQILRNCRYDFTISEVSADGYNTAAEAANNPSSNMDFDLVIWPSEQIRYMFFDNNDYFGLSELDVGLGGTANYTKQIDITTNLSGYALRFGTDGAWQQTLNNGVFSVTRTNGDQTLVVTALTNNFTPSYRKQLMQIQAGNLDPISVELIQASTPILLEWASRNVDALHTFAPNINSYGRLYQWNRTNSFTASSGGTNPPPGWSDILSESLVWSATNDPCPTGWRIPTSEDWLLFKVMYPFFSFRPTIPNNGTFYAATQEEADNATFANPGNAIFLPGAGWRIHSFGSYSLPASGDGGRYWSSIRSTGFNLFNIEINTLSLMGANNTAYPVRCVRDL